MLPLPHRPSWTPVCALRSYLCKSRSAWYFSNPEADLFRDRFSSAHLPSLLVGCVWLEWEDQDRTLYSPVLRREEV